jgi:hypothetical protein
MKNKQNKTEKNKSARTRRIIVYTTLKAINYYLKVSCFFHMKALALDLYFH